MSYNPQNPIQNPTFRHFAEGKEHLRIFKPILYRRAKVDFGIILTEVKGRWELKKYRKPTWAKNLTEDKYISTTSPHKKNLTVFVSMVDVSVGDEILIFKQNKYSKILITKKEDKTFGFRLLETWMNTVTKNHFPKNSYKVEA